MLATSTIQRLLGRGFSHNRSGNGVHKLASGGVVGHDGSALDVLQHQVQILAVLVVDDLYQLNQVLVHQLLHHIYLSQKCVWQATLQHSKSSEVKSIEMTLFIFALYDLIFLSHQRFIYGGGGMGN
jgi:hypothetical protein